MTQTSTDTTRSAGNQRRQYYIKQPFQRRFILQFALLMALGCVAFGVVLYLYATSTLTTSFVDSKLRVMNTAEFLLPALGITTFAIAGIVAVIAAVRLLFISHRIAGPLYRLEKTAQAVGDGDLRTTVRLRVGDELQDVARSVDGMVSDLRRRVEQIEEQTSRLREIIAKAKPESAAPPEFLQRLEDPQGRLDEALRRFRV